MVCCCQPIERKHGRFKAEDYSVHQLKKDSQEGIAQVKLSVLCLYQTDLTQDHEKQDRSKIMNNRTK